MFKVPAHTELQAHTSSPTIQTHKRNGDCEQACSSEGYVTQLTPFSWTTLHAHQILIYLPMSSWYASVSKAFTRAGLTFKILLIRIYFKHY